MSISPILQIFNPTTFSNYLLSVSVASLEAIMFHCTGIPSRAEWEHAYENGTTDLQRLKNMWYGWTEINGWSAGPHLVGFSRGVAVMTPLNQRGIGSPSYNRLGIFHFECNLDGASEQFFGTPTESNVIGPMAALYRTKKVVPSAKTLLWHNEDPETSHRVCPSPPGVLKKEDFIKAILAHPLYKGAHT